jgi:hypothetical protein
MELLNYTKGKKGSSVESGERLFFLLGVKRDTIFLFCCIRRQPFFFPRPMILWQMNSSSKRTNRI